MSLSGSLWRFQHCELKNIKIMNGLITCMFMYHMSALGLKLERGSEPLEFM